MILVDNKIIVNSIQQNRIISFDLDGNPLNQKAYERSSSSPVFLSQINNQIINVDTGYRTVSDGILECLQFGSFLDRNLKENIIIFDQKYTIARNKVNNIPGFPLFIPTDKGK